jgi:hypothetical protein
MPEELKKLVDLAKSVEPTGAQKEQQRRSFAYGNTRIENPLITRELIDEQAELIDEQAELLKKRDER